MTSLIQLIASKFSGRKTGSPVPAERDRISSDCSITRNDLVQVRPGFDPDYDLRPVVVERVMCGCVWGRQYASVGSTFITGVPVSEVKRVGRMAFALNGDPID